MAREQKNLHLYRKHSKTDVSVITKRNFEAPLSQSRCLYPMHTASVVPAGNTFVLLVPRSFRTFRRFNVLMMSLFLIFFEFFKTSFSNVKNRNTLSFKKHLTDTITQLMKFLSWKTSRE